MIGRLIFRADSINKTFASSGWPGRMMPCWAAMLASFTLSRFSIALSFFATAYLPIPRLKWLETSKPSLIAKAWE